MNADFSEQKRGDDGRSFKARRLTPGDVDLFKKMNALFGDAFEEVETYTSACPSDAYIENLLESKHFIALVAIKDGAVIGALAAYELRKFEQERSEIYIYDLAVDLAHRRTGVATDLIERVKEIARTCGAWTVFVQADLSDDPAISLYTKLGVREDVLHFDISPS